MLLEEDLLMQLTASIMDSLGDQVVGIYVGGGLADADFSPSNATVNLLVVTQDDPDEAMCESMRQIHQSIDDEFTDWGDRIDVEYLGLPGLAGYRDGEHRGLRSEAGEPLHVEPLDDINVLGWEAIRERSRSLVGDPADQVLPPISKDVFLKAVRHHASGWPQWVRSHTKTRNQVYSVLTMCRAWYSARRGNQASKREAALFTAAEFPDWEPLISWADEWWYAENPPKDESNHDQVIAFVDDISARVQDAIPRS